ncbi:MAG: DUF2283 domain-containing protein [Dehalococcoidia bacterium]
MKITYDSDADAVYIHLPEEPLEGVQASRTLRVNADVALDIGPDDTLMGIEILRARQVLGNGKRPTVTLESLPRRTEPQ